MRLLAFAFVAALSCSLSFQARAADPHPWESAQTVLDAVNVDFSAKGIMGVASHVDDLEHALAGAKDAVLALIRKRYT